jgi:thiol-disulfide isomerase/thioredoxin
VPASGPSAVQPSCQYDKTRQRLVDFKLPTLAGRAFRLQEVSADLVLLDFWGTWCTPCLNSVPHLVDLQKRYGNRLQIVGVAYEFPENASVAQERANTVRDVSSRLRINYPVLLGGADGRPCPLQTALKVQTFPTMVLIDRQGNILWTGSGSATRTLAKLDRAIASNASADVARR